MSSNSNEIKLKFQNWKSYLQFCGGGRLCTKMINDLLDLDFCKCGFSMTQNTSQNVWNAKNKFSSTFLEWKSLKSVHIKFCNWYIHDFLNINKSMTNVRMTYNEVRPIEFWQNYKHTDSKFDRKLESGIINRDICYQTLPFGIKFG